MARMVRIRQTIEIAAPADEVWRLVGRPEQIAEFHPQVVSVRLDRERRTCLLVDGTTVVERIVEHSVVHRFYTYELAERLASMRATAPASPSAPRRPLARRLGRGGRAGAPGGLLRTSRGGFTTRSGEDWSDFAGLELARVAA